MITMPQKILKTKMAMVTQPMREIAMIMIQPLTRVQKKNVIKRTTTVTERLMRVPATVQLSYGSTHQQMPLMVIYLTIRSFSQAKAQGFLSA